MSIDVQQPRPYDLVQPDSDRGHGRRAFEAHYNYRIHEGHDEVTGSSWPATAWVDTGSSN